MERRLLKAFLALCLAACALGAAPASANEPVARADQVKAAFLKRFVQFVEWPDVAAPDDAVTVGVMGEGDLGTAVLALDGGRIGDRSLVVIRLEGIETVPAGVHVVVVCSVIDGVDRTAHPRWKNLGWLKERPILTVGDDPDFMDAGGTFGFYLEGERVRFAARRHPILKISSKLLRLAKTVE